MAFFGGLLRGAVTVGQHAVRVGSQAAVRGASRVAPVTTARTIGRGADDLIGLLPEVSALPNYSSTGSVFSGAAYRASVEAAQAAQHSNIITNVGLGLGTVGVGAGLVTYGVVSADKHQRLIGMSRRDPNWDDWPSPSMFLPSTPSEPSSPASEWEHPPDDIDYWLSHDPPAGWRLNSNFEWESTIPVVRPPENEIHDNTDSYAGPDLIMGGGDVTPTQGDLNGTGNTTPDTEDPIIWAVNDTWEIERDRDMIRNRSRQPVPVTDNPQIDEGAFHDPRPATDRGQGRGEKRPGTEISSGREKVYINDTTQNMSDQQNAQTSVAGAATGGVAAKSTGSATNTKMTEQSGTGGGSQTNGAAGGKISIPYQPQQTSFILQFRKTVNYSIDSFQENYWGVSAIQNSWPSSTGTLLPAQAVQLGWSYIPNQSLECYLKPTDTQSMYQMGGVTGAMRVLACGFSLVNTRMELNFPINSGFQQVVDKPYWKCYEDKVGICQGHGYYGQPSASNYPSQNQILATDVHVTVPYMQTLAPPDYIHNFYAAAPDQQTGQFMMESYGGVEYLHSGDELHKHWKFNHPFRSFNAAFQGSQSVQWPFTAQNIGPSGKYPMIGHISFDGDFKATRNYQDCGGGPNLNPTLVHGSQTGPAQNNTAYNTPGTGNYSVAGQSTRHEGPPMVLVACPDILSMAGSEFNVTTALGCVCVYEIVVEVSRDLNLQYRATYVQNNINQPMVDETAGGAIYRPNTVKDRVYNSSTGFSIDY